MDYLVKFINAATRAPITGLTPTWTSLVKVSDGTAYTPQPAISELGVGYYKFTFAPAVDLVGRVDGGAALALSDRYAEVQAGPADAIAPGTVVVPLVSGRPATVKLLEQSTIELRRGDSYRLTFSLGADYTGWTARFGARLKTGTTLGSDYSMALRDCVWTDAAAGAGYVDIATSDTATIGQHVGEIELKSGASVRTPNEYRLIISDDIIK